MHKILAVLCFALLSYYFIYPHIEEELEEEPSLKTTLIVLYNIVLDYMLLAMLMVSVYAIIGVGE